MIRMDGGPGRLARGGATADERSLRARWMPGVLLVGLWFVPLAWALTGGSGPQDPAPGAPWAGVGSLDVGGRLFSGVLIGSQHVLTAAHVVAGSDPGTVRFRVALGSGFTATATEIHVNPAYTGNTTGNVPGDPSTHADLAIVRLDRPAPEGLQVTRFFGGSLLGRVLTLVSHGNSTTLITLGENRADAVFADALGRPATYLFDYDGPDLSSNRIGPAVPANGTLGAGREATLVSGDSGSAAFVQVDGQWGLAGINTFEIGFGTTPSARGTYGAGAGGIVLAGYRSWISEVLAAPPKPRKAEGSATSGSRR